MWLIKAVIIQIRQLTPTQNLTALSVNTERHTAQWTETLRIPDPMATSATLAESAVCLLFVVM